MNVKLNWVCVCACVSYPLTLKVWMNVKLNWVCVCVCMCKLPLNAESVKEYEVELSVCVCKEPLNDESANEC